MQQQTSIYIPKPCHQDWNTMTPAQQGKFCSACNKQVVDFSLMSDNQILKFLSNQSGKLCGRFDAEQLQRPLVETKIKKKKSWWMALTMPLLFLCDRSEAQHITQCIKPDTSISPTKGEPMILGKLAYQPVKEITIKGKVVDENNKPLAYASIIKKGTVQCVSTDSAGNFSFNVKDYKESVTLVASYVGYESKEIKIDGKKQNLIINMKLQPAITGDVVVVMGYAIRHKPVKSIDTLKTALKKFFRQPAFKIYPNPVINSKNINIEINLPGNYQMQMLDNQSRLIQTEEINRT